MKILVADDEAFIRISLKTMISSIGESCEIIGEAANGKEAVKLIREKMPDLTILDIKMPVMDGLEVIRLCSPNTRFLVLSSYNDFHLVRKAMKMGALDYIHKPELNEHVLKRSLMEIKQLIVNRNGNEQKNSRSIEHMNNEYRRLFFNHLREGSYKDDQQMDNTLNNLDLKIKNSNMCCMLLKLKSNWGNMEEIKSDGKSKIGNTVGNIIEEMLKDERETEYVTVEDRLYCIIKTYSYVKSEKDIYSYNLRLANNICDAFDRLLNIKTIIGISSVHRLSDYKTAYREASEVSGLGFYCNESKVFFYGNDVFNKSGSSGIYEENFYIKAQRLVRTDNFMELQIFLENLFQNKDYYLEKSKDEIIDIAKNLFVIISSSYIERINHKLIEDIYFPDINELNGAEDVFELHEFMKRCAASLERAANRNLPDLNNEAIISVIKYINQNYNNDLSLESISQTVNLNPSYLSRVFKKETGVNVIDYINKVRIRHAVTYITGGFKNYEIADMVGYKTVEHFNAMFKKETGYTPKDYKNQ